MNSHQPDRDPKELKPNEKTKRVRYITLAIVAFLVLVLVYMFANLKPSAEELPINHNPPAEEK